MTDSGLLSESLLHAVGVVIVSLSVLMVAAHTGILALAARRTTLSSSTQLSVPLVVGAALALWVGWAVLAVRSPVVVSPPEAAAQRLVQQPRLLLVMLAMFAAGILLLFASKSVRAINAATPPEWLIGVQSYRVAGGMFLWPFLAAGALPASFALPAGIGDVLTGIAAPAVALAIARGWPSARAWAIAWNCFGILDLILAPVAAVISRAPNVGRFPLVVVPLFLGPPLGILTHIYSLRNLVVSGGRAGSRPSAG